MKSSRSICLRPIIPADTDNPTQAACQPFSPFTSSTLPQPCSICERMMISFSMGCCLAQVYDTNSHLQIRTISRYPPARKPNNKGFFRSSTPAPPSTSASASTSTPAAASGAASASIASTAAASSVAASGGAKPGALGAAGAAAAADASASAPTGGRWPQEHHLSLLFGQDNKLYMGWPDCIKARRRGVG